MFQSIDTDVIGPISFKEFLYWAFAHITEKVANGVKVQYPSERVHEHMFLVSENLPIYDGDSSAAEFARSLTVAVSWIQCIGLNPLECFCMHPLPII